MITCFQEGGHRQYTDYNINLQRFCVIQLKEWNINRKDASYDRRSVGLLLENIFGSEILKKSSLFGTAARNVNVPPHDALDTKKIKFIRQLFKIRVKSDEKRESILNSIINKHCNNSRQ
jgi:translation elongation factor EF-Ts